MLYPAAGFILWLFLGGLVGFLACKVARTSTTYGTMASVGAGAVSAVVAGFATSFFFRGEQSNGGFWAGIIVALVAALVGVTLLRIVSPRGAVTTIR